MDARGLRDQAKMLRRDAKRYRGMANCVNNTVSYDQMMRYARELETRAIQLEAEARSQQPTLWQRLLRLSMPTE